MGSEPVAGKGVAGACGGPGGRRHPCRIGFLVAFVTGMFLPTIPVFPLPPFVPVEKRAAASGIVLVADVVSSTSQNLNRTFDSAAVQIHVIRVLKGPSGLPSDLALQFAVYPESFEARMREPPGPGRYFVFLDVVESPGEEGGTIVLFRLYEPNPFAFAPWDEAMEQRLIKFLKKEKSR